MGVIGTGASAFQFVPIISRQAASVTVFQRTAPWVVPNPDYFHEVPAGKHWLLNHVPFYAKWFRFTMFWRAAEGLLGSVAVDDKWQVSERSVSEANEQFRQLLIENMKAHFADRPDLVEKCTPDYPPGAKRALIDDGTWFEALKRDNVSLVTDPIERITETGLETRSGDDYDFDVLVFATGFMASEFMHPVKIYGLGGVEIHDAWKGEPRAYKGINVPGFPNLFCCYGPNTNIVVNGSIVFFSECEIRYILGCLALLMKEHKAALDVKRDVHDAYNRRIEAVTSPWPGASQGSTPGTRMPAGGSLRTGRSPCWSSGCRPGSPSRRTTASSSGLAPHSLQNAFSAGSPSRWRP